jgi:hypothetical protein
MKTAYIGIDPGASGAIAVIDSDLKLVVLRLQKVTDKDVSNFLQEISFNYDRVFCVKEKVWAMPAKNPDGTMRTMGAQTMFEFGLNNGFILGLLTAWNIAYEEKTPQTWMKLFSMKREKEESQTDYKRKLKEQAEKLFPNIKITNDMADAILIAEFNRRTKTW